MVHTKEKNKNL